MKTIATTDLMKASFMICLGAEVDKTEYCGRFYKVYLSVPSYACERGRDKADRLKRLFSRSDSLDELSIIYDQSFIKEVSAAYYSLKRRLSKERASNDK
jgi:hypothetical protein